MSNDLFAHVCVCVCVCVCVLEGNLAAAVMGRAVDTLLYKFPKQNHNPISKQIMICVQNYSTTAITTKCFQHKSKCQLLIHERKVCAKERENRGGKNNQKSMQN